MMPMGLMTAGEKAEVKDVGGRKSACSCGKDNTADACSQLEDMGLRAGQIVEMLTNSGKGPILLKIDNSRIAIDRGMAMKILVSMEEEI